MSLAKVGLEKFSKIQLDGKDVEVGEDKTLAVKNSKLKLNMVFTEEGKKTAVKGVILHKKNGKSAILEKKAYFDLLGGAEGYDFPKSHYVLNIYATLDDDAEIEVIYEGSKEDKLSKPYGNDLLDDGYNGKNNTKTKYPVVFLESPALMAVIPSNNDRTVSIEGFIGNVKKDDKVKTIEVKLVDEKGKAISDTITLSGKDIKSMEKKYAYGGTSPYRGLGYPFSVTLPVSKFCVNIRVEAVTEKGEKASIVRRAFYDLKDPTLTYEVMKRELDSDSVTIKLHSEDDSLRLKLYNGDSLIDIADKTHKTMAEGGVVLDTEIKIPLKTGQNKINIRAVDLANFKIEKNIYVYRTK